MDLFTDEYPITTLYVIFVTYMMFVLELGRYLR